MKKKHLVVAASLGFAQLALQVNAGRAQSAKKQDTVKNLNEVVVTATRSQKKLSDIGRVVTVITSEQINQSQGKTVPALLNTVPGITFSGAENNRGVSSDVYIRGANSGNTLILIDGFPVNDASSIGGAYDLNAFPTDQIERIEILRGSNSTLYGSDAVAGVINIITKKALKQALAGTLQLGAGSYETYQGALGLNGQINNTGVAITLSGTNSRGFSTAADPSGNNTFSPNGFRQKSISANFNTPVSQKLVFNANVQATNNAGDSDNGSFNDAHDYTFDRTFLFGGLGAKVVLPKGTFVLNASQNNVSNNFTKTGSDSKYYFTSKNLGRITNIESVVNYNFGDYFDITSGGDFKYSYADQLYVDTYSPNAPAIKSSNSITSAYSSLFFKSDLFHMELGGRYNHHTKYGDNFTYTINPSILFDGRYKIFASMASAFKAPSLYQLFSQYGTIDLKPETTTSYEVGFDLQIIQNILSINTEFYKRKTSDVIYFYTDPTTFASHYQNGSFEDDKGFESELNLKLADVSFSAFAAYVVGKQTNANGAETNVLLRRPKNTYGASVSCQPVKALSIGLNYKYTGDRSDIHFLGVAPYVRVEGLPQYNLVDAHLQLQATKKFNIYFDIKNLFNEKYVDWIGYNTRGFNVFGGIKYIFN